MQITAPVALAACSVLAMVDARAEPPAAGSLEALRARVAEAVRPYFTQVEPKLPRGADPTTHTTWRPNVGLVLPAVWPPNGDGMVAFRVHAIGLRSGLMDGAHTGAPWVRVAAKPSDPAGKLVVTLTARSLVDLGIQGVRPVAREVFEGIHAAERLLVKASERKGPPGPEAAKPIRDGYCLWLGMNGVIARELRKLEPAFFAWLACREEPR